MPTRSKRLAAQSISHIPASKRGEFLVKKRLGLGSEQQAPPTAKQLFRGDPKNLQALTER
jgi:hypothetical protein